MAKHKAKHAAKRGQVRRNKHQAGKDDRKKRLFNQPEGIEAEALTDEGEDLLPEEEVLPVEPEEEPAETEPEEEPAEEPEEEPAGEEEPVEEESEEEPETEPEEVAAEEPEEEPAGEEEPAAEEPEEEPAESETEEEPAEEPEEEPESPPAYDEVFEEEEQEEEKKRSWKALKIATFLILVAIILCVAYVMTDKYILSPEKFQQETTINEIDVSGLTEEQAKEKITNTINGETLEILEDGKKIGSISGFDFDYEFGDQVEKCLHPDYPNKLTRLFRKEDRDYTIKLTTVGNDKTFDTEFKALKIVKNAKGTEQTKNAYVDLSTHDFDVVSEVYGNSVDTKKLKAAMLKNIAANEMEFDYDAETFRQEPEIKANSPEIKERLDFCHKYLGQTIRLNTFKGPYTITPKEMNKFIKVDEQGNRIVRKKKLKKFVKKLKENFSIYGGNYDLDLVGGHVQVSGGDYGVTVDNKKEYNQLLKDLNSNMDVSRDMFYEGGKSPADGNDVGDTYVEIDISRQRLWCVVDGKTVVKSDVVTGNVADGHATPTGVYSIAYKVSPCTLRGENADGSKYESKVTYWMPFNGGIGCHDATWRGSFGGSIYQYSGSHGCVNMPYSKAEELYYNVDTGVPVVVHD